MIKIKFRALADPQNEWIYGFYCFASKAFGLPFDTPTIQQFNDSEDRTTAFRQIKPDTVGQFTSLYDKKDKEIYEGDILGFTIFDHYDHDTQHIGVVKWSGCTCYVECSEDDIYHLDCVCEQDCEVEILGNIYDNPELLNS